MVVVVGLKQNTLIWPQDRFLLGKVLGYFVFFVIQEELSRKNCFEMCCSGVFFLVKLVGASSLCFSWELWSWRMSLCCEGCDILAGGAKCLSGMVPAGEAGGERGTTAFAGNRELQSVLSESVE